MKAHTREWDGTKTAVITGSSRRLGKMIAGQLVQDGWKVMLHGRDDRLVAEVKREIGARCAVSGDLCEEETVESIADGVDSFFGGKLGLLVNSASTLVRDGRTLDQRWDRFPDSLWQAHWAYCLTIELTQAIRSCDGLAVNLTDWACEEEWRGFVAHGMAKNAMEAMAVQLGGGMHLGKERMSLVSLRLPTVLLPDNLAEGQAEVLIDTYGPLVDPEIAVYTVCQLAEEKNLRRVAVMYDDGTVTWRV